MSKFVPQAELPVSEQAQIRRDKLTALREAGKDPFTITKYNVTGYSGTIKETFVDPAEGEESTMTVSLAGRIMSKRGMGKASFADLQDKEGRIQLYVRKDMVAFTEISPIWVRKTIPSTPMISPISHFLKSA